MPTREPRAPRRAAAAAAIVRACRRLAARGLIAGPDGNVSVRLAGGTILITPAGASKGELTAAQLVELTPEGAVIKGVRPSSEVGMHLMAYRRRPDVGAVVHAHPPTATGFAVAGEDLLPDVLPEIILQVGRVRRLPYVTPGTADVAAAFEPWIEREDAFLLSNHGATTLGPTLEIALQRMESVEHAACIMLAARTLGRVNRLTQDQVRVLEARRLDIPASAHAEHPGMPPGEETR